MSGPSNAGRNPDGTFKRGTVGNPRGKPKGTRHRTTIMAETLMADAAGEVVRATIRSALEGETAAQKLLLDRIAPPRRGRPVPLALPEVTTADSVLKALAAVVAAMSRGELSPDEAQTVAAVVAAPRAVLEVQEIERRLLALEERLARGERPPLPPEGEEPA